MTSSGRRLWRARRIISVIVATLACLCLPVRQATAAYPDRPITIVVPYPPGGPADLMARSLSGRLQQALGTPVLVRYLPGAGGKIALRHVREAQNDGYTIVLVLAAYAIGPLLDHPAEYDPATSFEPIALLAKQPLVLYSRKDSAFATVSQLMAQAKAKPGSVSIASSGYGNTSHLAVELLARAAGVGLTHVPYHGGVPSVTAVMGGQVDAVFAGADSLRFVGGGKLRALAVAGDSRLAIAPDVPTFAEAGMPDMSVEGWYGLLAPRGTSSVRIQVLNRAVERVVADASFNELVANLGFKVAHAGPSSFRSFIEREMARWGRLIVERNITRE